MKLISQRKINSCKPLFILYILICPSWWKSFIKMRHSSPQLQLKLKKKGHVVKFKWLANKHQMLAQLNVFKKQYVNALKSQFCWRIWYMCFENVFAVISISAMMKCNRYNWKSSKERKITALTIMVNSLILSNCSAMQFHICKGGVRIKNSCTDYKPLESTNCLQLNVLIEPQQS